MQNGAAMGPNEAEGVRSLRGQAPSAALRRGLVYRRGKPSAGFVVFVDRRLQFKWYIDAQTYNLMFLRDNILMACACLIGIA